MPFVTASASALSLPAGLIREGNPFAEPDPQAFARWFISQLNKWQRSDVCGLHYANLSVAYSHLRGLDVEGVGANAAVVTRSGEQGSIAEMRIPNAASLLEKAHNVIVGPELSWEPIATTTDYASAAEVELARNGLLYYWNDLGVSQLFKKARFQSGAYAEGVVHLYWDTAGGKPTAPRAPGSKELMHEGEPRFEVIPSWDLLRDPTLRSYANRTWDCVRTWRNKYDVAAALEVDGRCIKDEAELADVRARCMNSKQSFDYWTPLKQGYSDTDLIPVYCLYHHVTPSIGEGRQTRMLADGTALGDGPLDKEWLKLSPVLRVASAEYDGTPWPYSKWFGTLGSQQASDALDRDLLTNATATSAAVVIAEQGADLSPSALTGGVKLVLVPKGFQMPQVLKVNSPLPEHFKLGDRFGAKQQQIMGLDALTTGVASGEQLSGAAMAVLTSTTVQNNSQEQADWAKFVADGGTALMRLIQARFSTPRKIAMAGSARTSLVVSTELSGQKIQNIDRVQVTVAGAMSQTAAGRETILEQALKEGWIQTPQMAQSVRDTGRLDSATQGLSNELLLINAENEALSRGEAVPVMLDDDHALHLSKDGHRTVTSSLVARQNPAVVKAVQDHQNEHLRVLMETNPMILQALGQTPLAPAPMPGAPAVPGAPGPMPDQAQAQQQEHKATLPTNPATGQKAAPAGGEMPPALAVKA